jgi:high-affinity K+ transport system ATPase subunit B
MKMVTVYIALIIALLPEAVLLAFNACILNYSRDEDISTKMNIIYTDVKALETIGQVNFICFDATDIMQISDRKHPRRTNTMSILRYMCKLPEI